MELVPIREHLHENEQFINHPECSKNLGDCIDFYKTVGYNPPWICYYVKFDGEFVGGFAFKGKPVNQRVEIAYTVFNAFRNKGIGTRAAMALVELAAKTDPNVIVTARTLPAENFSARLLRRNNFRFAGVVHDERDGNVWEWEYNPSKSPQRGDLY